MFRRTHYTDRQIVRIIEQGGPELDACLRFLYRRYASMIHKLVIDNSGREEEAEDIFQEVVVIFYEQVKSGSFVLNAGIGTYLYAIARNRWLNRLRKKRQLARFQEQRLMDDAPGEAGPLYRFLEKEQCSLLNKLMGKLRPDCRKILQLSIFEQLPMKEIYPLMGYQNEQIARNKKYKCLNYLKKIILEAGAAPDLMD